MYALVRAYVSILVCVCVCVCVCVYICSNWILIHHFMFMLVADTKKRHRESTNELLLTFELNWIGCRISFLLRWWFGCCSNRCWGRKRQITVDAKIQAGLFPSLMWLCWFVENTITLQFLAKWMCRVSDYALKANNWVIEYVKLLLLHHDPTVNWGSHAKWLLDL